MNDAAAAPGFVITLVHGTWADTRGWVAPGSFLRRELEGQLGSVVFREFAWTSAHTHAARAEAGVRLGKFIRAGHAQYPGAKHVVIAHSHGGVVALYALRDAEANRVISGIVTLATPFVYARRRRFGPYVGVMTFVLIAGPVVAGAMVLSALQVGAFGLAWIAGGVAAMVAFDSRLSKRVIGFFRQQQTDAMASMLPPAIDPSRLLVLCSRRDEVRGWLEAWDAMAHAPFMAAGALLSTLGVLATVLMPRVQDYTWPNVLAAAAALTIAGLLVSGVVRGFGYGREWLWPHLFVAIGSARTPGAAKGESHTAYVFDVAPPGERVPVTRRLRHKVIHEVPSVVAHISEWISRDGTTS